MGQYCYLIEKTTRICVEAYKLSGGGEVVNRIEEAQKLVRFLEHCREMKLQFECVSEHWFNEESNPENPDWKPFKELDQ